MKYKAVFAVTLFFGTLAFGQMSPEPPVMGGLGRGGPGGRQFGMRPGKVVTGAPYSATITNTLTKKLVDGNTIQRTTTGTVARDSQGRTYSNETVSGMFGQAGARNILFISDPVAGFIYSLNAETKTAMRRPLHAHTPGAGDTGAFPNRPPRPADPNIVTEDKGSQLVNGVTAQGKLTTHTIPAGTIGNEKPIVATTETWYSPDLQVVIASTRNDPREGTSVYALTNIQRAEPSSALFQVPSDYTIKDAPSFGPR